MGRFPPPLFTWKYGAGVLVRLAKDAPPGSLLDAVKARGAPHVIAAEYRSLRGLGNE